MSKTSTKKSPNRKHTSTTSTATVQTHARHAATAASVADAKKRVSLGNTGAASKLRKKSRKKLSHQQAAEARDTLDAEFRDMRRVGVSTRLTRKPRTYTLLPAPNAPPSSAVLFLFPNDVVVCAFVGGLIYPFFTPFTAYARVCPAVCRR
jgi:hypothetical protein